MESTVFMASRSQAVRLPKAYRFDTDEVTIEKMGDAVVLRPKAAQDDHEAWVKRLTEALAGFEDMDFIERDRRPPVDDIESWD